jgi:hypothetical protein
MAERYIGDSVPILRSEYATLVGFVNGRLAGLGDVTDRCQSLVKLAQNTMAFCPINLRSVFGETLDRSVLRKRKRLHCASVNAANVKDGIGLRNNSRLLIGIFSCN